MGNRVAVIADTLTIKIGGHPGDQKASKGFTCNKICSTKYNLITFLPQNLLEQFRRIANFYFLIMTIIAIIIDSPVSPLTSLVPLVFVIAVTATKQGYEDYLRHKADNMVNYSLVTIIRNGVEKDIRCQEIMQGDLVKVSRDCDVPCDLVLLKSADKNGKCHITTANLDGETNLKTLVLPKGLPTVENEKLHTLGIIECEPPQTDLYSFNGRIELAAQYGRGDISERNSNPETINVLPLANENLLLRGSRVKNTEWAIGCAVYTGQSTKLALNSIITRNKMTSSETFINKFLIFFLILLIAIVTVSYFIKRYYDLHQSQHNIYLGLPVDTYQVSQFLQDYFSFLILFNYLIPISLYVTIEMHKFLGSFFMEWDPDLYDAATDQPCIVNTSDLNEELGQIRILFSDKTGTLTKNEMIFQQCSINSKKYMYTSTGLQLDGHTAELKLHEFDESIYAFFEALAFCHTVQVQDIADSQGVTDTTTVRHETETGGQILSRMIREESEATNLCDSETEEHKLVKVLPATTELKAFGTRVMLGSSFLTTFDETDRVQMCPHGDDANGDRNGSVRRLRRPLSQDFVEPPDVIAVRAEQLTHKRSQSDAAPADRRTVSYEGDLNTTSSTLAAPKMATRSNLRRAQSFLASQRESYAAESYTERSRLERNESIYSRTSIKTFLGNLDYQASSPDEKALVEACAGVGFVFTGDNNNVLTVQLQATPVRKDLDEVDAVIRRPGRDRPNLIQMKRLHVLEFTSDRKRMSVIVKDRRQQIWIYTKGAESHVLPLCNTATNSLGVATQNHVNDFAKLGLRTLAVARRKITASEYSRFSSDLLNASNSLVNRKELVEECQRKIETNLELLGATAVEDALQDNVQDTLESLRMAGIKVWVLTGDKIETALNIALSCGHIPDNAMRYFITECGDEQSLHNHLQIFGREMRENPQAIAALLIDGPSLAIALRYAPTEFRDVAIQCRAVLACRLSPLQKCEVVRLMKTVDGNPITAAIGDGANDVSMIQEAHVGLGIVGREGRQAARCADYAFANFSMVKKILLVHGHYFSQRLAMLVLYFFYKNLVFMLIQFYFQIDSMFSSQSIYDSLFLTLYNVVFTALPILFVSLTEKVYTEKLLLTKPHIYRENVNNKKLHWRFFIGWMLLAVYHSLVVYLFASAIWYNNNAILADATTVNFYCFGTFMIHNVVILVNLKLWLVTRYQSYWFIITIVMSIVAFVFTTFIYNLLDLSWFDGDMLMVYSNLLSSLMFWLLFGVVIVTALLPDYTFKVCNALNIVPDHLFPGYKRKKVAAAVMAHVTSEQTRL